MKRLRSTARLGSRARIATSAIAIGLLAVATLSVGAASARVASLEQTKAAAPAEQTKATGTRLDQIKQTGRVRLGYRTDARPLSFKDESGNAAGYSVELCQRVADAMKIALSMPQLAVEWVPVTAEGRFQSVRQGEVDLLCGAESANLARRAEVSFSIPTFPGGIGALVRADSPYRLREVLMDRTGRGRPIWRGTVDPALHAGKFSAVTGTTGEQWLNVRAEEFQIATQIALVPSYDAGVKGVLDRVSNALFGDRAILLDAARRSPAAKDLVVLDRLFTYEPLALALPRGDEDFRLIVDRTISRSFKTGEAAALYVKWCGEPDAETLTFFKLNMLPD